MRAHTRYTLEELIGFGFIHTWMNQAQLSRQVHEMKQQLHQLKQGARSMAIDLTRTLAAVENETSVDNSILALVTTLADEVRNSGSDDPAIQAALDEAATTMESNAQRILDAVNANTPAPEPTPEPTPEPAPPAEPVA